MTILHNFAVFLFWEETRDSGELAALYGDEQPENKQQEIKLTLPAHWSGHWFHHIFTVRSIPVSLDFS